MKRIVMPILIVGALGLMSEEVEAAPTHELLVGTYTQGSSEGIYRYAFDTRTGQIAPEPLQVVKSANPSWLTLSRDQHTLFVVNENGPGQADPAGRVSSFSIDRKSHQISPVNQVASLGDEPTHSSLSSDGRYLFVANYAVQPTPGGSVSVIPVGEGGQLSAVVQQESHEASHVNPERQASSHVHSVVSSPDGRSVFVSDLGADKVFVYRYDANNQARPLTAANPAEASLPAGSGPRHLVFSKDGKHAYLTLEMSAQVAVFDYHDGSLIQRQLVALTDKPEAQARAAGALHVSPDGRFLYVSNRGTANELLVYAIDPATGMLKSVQRRSVEGDHPREFSLDPSGKFVLIANQKSNRIVVLDRDPKTGMLGKTVQKFSIDSPSDLKFLPAR
ncbi:lactonase family protein [Pseudomonas sp. R5(2019)]|uniref:lactonase family protein n=1 Tax=Pseudomonas sp. R5(2019) TaxID=2697566 RepID=UPI0014120D84|nr:lactonase family protein [Pseudomonas sp. R5(2019)]NBA94302.1 beta-propeller fold lactonase family protein [Pseudomonas sp. R5(2019)]